MKSSFAPARCRATTSSRLSQSARRTRPSATPSPPEIASLSGKDAFNVYKLLHALAALGLVKARVASDAPTLDFADAGVADASEAWAAETPTAPEPPAVPPPVTTATRSAFD